MNLGIMYQEFKSGMAGDVKTTIARLQRAKVYLDKVLSIGGLDREREKEVVARIQEIGRLIVQIERMVEMMAEEKKRRGK